MNCPGGLPRDNSFNVHFSSGIIGVQDFRTFTLKAESLCVQQRTICTITLHLIRVVPVCYSDKHFVNFSPDN